MNMKFLLSLGVFALILTACETKQQKVDEAKDKLEDAKQDLRDAKSDLNSEYPAFKREQEQELQRNEDRIAELRKMINTGGKPLDKDRAERIQRLESRNAELRSQLYGYEKAHGDWETFKRDFKKSMDDLGNSLRSEK